MTGFGKPTSESTSPSECKPTWQSLVACGTHSPLARAPLKKAMGLAHLTHLTRLIEAISLPTSLHDHVGAIHWIPSERLSVV
jgi:hypothetical protein